MEGNGRTIWDFLSENKAFSALSVLLLGASIYFFQIETPWFTIGKNKEIIKSLRDSLDSSKSAFAALNTQIKNLTVQNQTLTSQLNSKKQPTPIVVKNKNQKRIGIMLLTKSETNITIKNKNAHFDITAVDCGGKCHFENHSPTLKFTQPNGTIEISFDVLVDPNTKKLEFNVSGSDISNTKIGFYRDFSSLLPATNGIRILEINK